MEKLVIALGPAFAAGFAVQQLLEILDPLIIKIIGKSGDKKLVLGLLSLIAGLGLAFGAGLRVLEPLGAPGGDIVDAVVTGLIISAGTEGLNSILKFVGYSKQKMKATAAEAQMKAGTSGMALMKRK